MVRRLCAGLLGALIILVAVGPVAPVGAASGDKILNRVQGSVGYQAAASAPLTPIFGPVDLPDDAYAVTQAGSRATLQLRDSSVIDIGERTSVKVGAFTMPGATTTGNLITLDRGAVKFTIHHPAGVRSNYTFATPTSQIAVRGTEAFLVVGPNGTQVVCVECAPGDVSITIGGQTISLVSGQTLTVLGTSPANATFTVHPNGPFTPATSQFVTNPGTLVTDPTGFTVGLGGGAAAGALTIPLVVAGVVVGAVAVANSSNGGTTPPTPTPTPSGGTTATPTPSPSPTASPTSSPSPSPAPSSSSSASPVPYGTLMVNPTALSFNTVPQTLTFTVQQTGPGGTISIAAPNCDDNGASATDSPPSAAISPSAAAVTISVTAQSAPNSSPPPTHACTIAISGGGGQTATVTLDIHSTQVGVGSHARATPSASPSPTPVPAPKKH